MNCFKNFGFTTAVLLMLLPTPTDTLAHDAPSGWSYPTACCAGYECREVPASWVDERPYGYHIVPTDERLAYTDTRVKDSPDGSIHWCSVAGKDDGRTICLFVPPKGF